MTLEELTAETLVQKNRRLLQAKCQHPEVYSSTVASRDGIFTNAFCLDCGKDLSPAKPEHMQEGE